MIVALVSGLVCMLLLAVDLITKAVAHATEVNQATYFLDIVRLKFQWNDGIAWGMFGNNPIMMAVITALTGLMIVGIAVLFFTYFKGNTPARVALAVIEAGAIGNFIDRVACGGKGVRDFINIRFLLPEYTCNIADMYIVLGAIALVFIILFIGKHSAFPLTKKWREEAKAEEEAQKKKKGKATK